MSKVFLITQGDYSDYSVVNVLTTRELAEEFRDYYNKLVGKYNKCEIEEYELDRWIPQFRENLKQYDVEIDVEGNVRRCQPTRGVDTWRPDVTIRSMIRTDYMRKLPRWETVKKELDKYCVVGLNILCWAKDKEHAIKIANEKRTVLLGQSLMPSINDIDKFQSEKGYWNTVESFWEWKNNYEK